MPIEEFQLPGEEVKAKAGSFYATDQRLLRHSRFLWWQEFDEVSYRHMTALSLVAQRRKGLLWLGSFLVVMALLGTAVLALLGASLPNLRLPPLSSLFLLLGGVGVGAMLLWAVFPASYYQVRALGLNEKLEPLWRIGRVGSKATRQLVAAINEHRGKL